MRGVAVESKRTLHFDRREIRSGHSKRQRALARVASAPGKPDGELSISRGSLDVWIQIVQKQSMPRHVPFGRLLTYRVVVWYISGVFRQLRTAVDQ